MCLPGESLNRASYGTRLLFASYHCYADPSSGAAIATRDLLELLAPRAWDARVFCGPALDFERGESFRQLLSDQGTAYRERRSSAGSGFVSKPHPGRRWSRWCSWSRRA